MYSKRRYLKGACSKRTITLLLALIVGAAMHAEIASGQTPVLAPTPNYRDSAVLGWDGDLNGVIAHLDGSYHLRRGNDGGMPFDVIFGISNNPPAPLYWYNEAGYLPCYITEFVTSDGTTSVKITNFGDQITILGNKYVAIYTRIKLTNLVTHAITVCPSPTVAPNPAPASGLVQLTGNSSCTTLSQQGKSVTYDYVIAVDRFNGTYNWPSALPLIAAGSWDSHHSHMVSYWTDKLGGIVNVQTLGDPDLINAYKAGYIYTHIIKDPAVGSTPAPGGTPPHHELKVGEDNYEQHYFHNDRLGILSTLLTLGDPEAATLLNEFPTASFTEQPQAGWLYPWLWAIYLEKYNNSGLAINHFGPDIMRLARAIHSDRCLVDGPVAYCGNDPGYEPNGLMHQTEVYGYDYWAYDDWSALMGLASYSYVCGKLSRFCEIDPCLYTTEKKWADAEYDDLLAAVNARHAATIDQYHLDYLPASMTRPNDQILLGPWDANWGLAFQFGRWAWDGYLLGAQQYGVEFDLIDSTYRSLLDGNGLEPHNFGAYWYGAYSSTYNAGYGSAGFVGVKYRTEGIDAYNFMLAKGQSGPYSWWESFWPQGANPWVGIHPSGPIVQGTFSCPHMFGQSTATKVLIDSLVALKGNNSVIIGRGVPNSWVTYGGHAGTEFVHVSNFPIDDNRRMEFTLTGVAPNQIRLNLLGSQLPSGDTILDLRVLKYNIRSATAGSTSQPDGTVNVPPGTTTTTVTVVTPNAPTMVALREAEQAILTACYQQIDPNALGGYRVDGIDQIGDSVEFTDCPAGSHLIFGYATPWPGIMGVYVNGSYHPVYFANTGAWDVIGQTAVSIEILDHASVKVQFDSGSLGINLDYMQIY